jgi:hypothetical protein
MQLLTENRELLINNKIFAKNDIISLIKLLIKHSSEILHKSKEAKRQDLIQKTWKKSTIMDGDIDTSHSRTEFTSSDHLKYTGTFDEISGITDILNNKTIIEINLYFVEQVLGSSILIRIKNSDTSPAYAKVEGQNKEWVDETIKKLEEFFSGCRSQSTIVKKYGILIVPLIVLILNFFLNNSIEIISRHMHIFPKYAMHTLTGDWRFYVIILSLITISPALLIYGRLMKLWPGIEIQTGNDLDEIETEKINKVWLIVSIIIIPALVSLVVKLF